VATRRGSPALAVGTAVALVCTAFVGGAGAAPAKPAAAYGTGGNWYTWQHDPLGTRNNPAERQITAATVGRLTLKWAFAYPDVPFATPGSQPAVVDGTVYVGAPDARFHALDAGTGVTRWSFDLTTVSGPVDARNQNPVRDGASVVGDRVVFGDTRGYLYALDRASGALVWSTRLDTHPATRITSSPLVYRGRVYVGVSSIETGNGFATDPSYPCCTFRGSVVALDADTGALIWRYHAVPPAVPAGTWPSGATRYSPSGGAVWGSPVIDPSTDTLVVGTGQNYTGHAGDIDSVLALDPATGSVRWKYQATKEDVYTAACFFPSMVAYCEGRVDSTDLDFDFGSSPNVFVSNGRSMVGIGQKSGIYFALDARTGAVAWMKPLSDATSNGADTGIQWGTSWDGNRIYAATWNADPGTLYALDPATGAVEWQVDSPADGCSWGGAAGSPPLCQRAFTPAVTTTRDLVFEGSADGKMRVYSSATGAVLWEYDTIRDFAGVNGLTGRGSALSGNGGAVVAGGMLYVQSGYYPFYPTAYGHVLLAFGLS
jgi:polyvinyl alcohol dehydrogenase (cytochrome)